MGTLWRKNEPSKGSPSKLRRWVNRLKGENPQPGVPGKALSGNFNYKQDEHDIMPKPSNSSQVVDSAKSSSAEDSGTEMTIPESLWDLAYEALREEKPEVIKSYEELLSKILPCLENASSSADLKSPLSETLSEMLSKMLSDQSTQVTPMSDTETPGAVGQSLASRRKLMEHIIDIGQKHMDGRRIAVDIGQQRFVLRDQMQYVVAGIQAGKDWINDAVKASPLASAAWVGVCLFLPLLTNPSEVQTANEEGLAYVAQKIRYYTAMESHFMCGQDEDVFPAVVKQEYKERLVELYQAIIDFQAQSVLRFFRRRFGNVLRDTVKWDSWEEMLKKVKELGDNLEKESLQINTTSIRAALGRLAKWAQESDENKCLQSLRRGDYAWYKDRVEARVPDTCLWFLNHASYQSWLEADSGPLLVSADPGCGKSVLAKYLIESSFGFRVSKEVAICYFFFKEGDQNTIAQAFSALIHQLFCLRPQLIRHALPRYKQDGEKLTDNVTALWDVLQGAAADPEAGSIIIVLDALDECLQDERNMATLSRYIRKHFEQGPKNLKILMTSRPYQSTIKHIQELEDSLPNIRIKGEDESEIIREEINSVIEFRVGRMKLNDELKAHLKQSLVGITHRTYLWLYLVFSYLESTIIKNTTGGLDRAIQNLPGTVSDAYEKMLSRSTDPKETRKAILILLAAYRPLTLGEMQVALDLSLDITCLEILDLEPDESFKIRLRELCGLFITVHDNKLYFLHQTAREFLLPLSASSPSPAINTINTMVWAHTFTIRQAHTILAESCTIFLHLFNSLPDESTKAEFLNYSIQNWGDHFHDAVITDDAAIVPFASRIFDEYSKSYAEWINIHGRSVGLPNNLPSVGLLIASYFGHEAIVKLLLNTDNISVDSKNRRNQTPLSLAAENGHLGVVELLLNSGANINLKNWHDQSPLSLAIANGHQAVVALLFDAGASIVLKTQWDDALLSSILGINGNGLEGNRRFLLNEVTDVYSEDDSGEAPLFSAAHLGREAVDPIDWIDEWD
ncbi:hypothetical protein F4825DRAFT_440007 [Nemania diffusa]|nr:hypothetical protein F4825DRAFT_440007 [Nemania diffusa]